MNTVRTLVRAALSVVLFTMLVGIVGRAGEGAVPTNLTPVVNLNIGGAARKAAKIAIEREILPGEIPGIRSTMISLAPGVTHRERASGKEDRVFLVLSGKGMITANGKRHSVTKETIAHFPIGWSVNVKASGTEGLDILILRLTITPVDREHLAAHPALTSVAYVKAFSECEAYGEAIKSAKTVSRTLLPKNIVPRMAIGTVETTGPDTVRRHRHPMLEQYFLGLEHNDITVLSDSARTALKEHELFHIPSGSDHGSVVAEGSKLYYVWMDFFQDEKGMEWLKMHKSLTPGKNP